MLQFVHLHVHCPHRNPLRNKKTVIGSGGFHSTGHFSFAGNEVQGREGWGLGWV